VKVDSNLPCPITKKMPLSKIVRDYGPSINIYDVADAIEKLEKRLDKAERLPWEYME